MKLRPRSKASQWNAGEVLQAIPRIQKILATPPCIKYRSLSESFNPQVGMQQLTTFRKQVKKSKGLLLKPNLLLISFESAGKALKNQRIRKSFEVGQNTQFDGIQFKKLSKSVKPREKYEIPVIKLEKSLPGHEGKELKTREKQKKDPKIEKNRLFKKRARKNMKDESVGNDYLLTQSSGVLSQSSLVNKYLIVLQPDLNNY